MCLVGFAYAYFVGGVTDSNPYMNRRKFNGTNELTSGPSSPNPEIIPWLHPWDLTMTQRPAQRNISGEMSGSSP